VNAVLVLMGLLVLSYLGSLIVSGRTTSAVGLPSGVEYAALGFVLGPTALGIVGADTLAAFEPVVQVAIGWLAFGVGLDFGYVRERRVHAASLVSGGLGALWTAVAVAAATWWVAGHFHFGASATERVLLAGGAGVACAETTRHAVRRVVERHGARGPLADRLNEIAHADELLPVIAVAVLFALEPIRTVSVRMPLRDWPAITVGLGLLLGGGAALLLRSQIGLEEAWGLLFGVALIGIGASASLGLSTLTASFFAGLATSMLSRHGRELRAMVGPTERPVLLPALLLAGARLDFRATAALPWIAAAAIGARVVAKVVMGWALAALYPPARRGGSLVGLSMLSSGALAMSIGLAFALRFPGAIGDTVLVVAVISATVGELVGPLRLRRTLQRAGEIDAGSAAATPAREGLEAAG
jgi:Kef-type K+ transport system membrane component KefB